MTTQPSTRSTAFPYTLGYLQQLLEVDEQILMSYVHALAIQPQQDDITGSYVFTQQDVDLIRRAIQTQQSGLGQSIFTPDKPLSGKKDDSLLTRQVLSVTSPPASTGQDNFSLVVEAVNQVKEGILKDLSRLLDDKLSGLDEVVVELIRAKTDNDLLKQRLVQAHQDNDVLKQEISRFKLVQFGFYRKHN